MNMIKSMQRGIAVAGLSLVCLMGSTMNVKADSTGIETEIVSVTDVESSTTEDADLDVNDEASDTLPSGPASDTTLTTKSEKISDTGTDDEATDANIETTDSASDSVLETIEDTAPETPTEIYAGRFTTTAYCSCRKCCKGGKNLTKSGTIPRAGHTISADLNVFPLGTKLRIGDVVYTVEDSGSGIKGNKLDIFFNSHNQALQYGRQSADVYIVQ